MDSLGCASTIGSFEVKHVSTVSLLRNGALLHCSYIDRQAQQGDNAPYSVAAFADFNGDGKIDVAYAIEGGALIGLGNGDGTFPNFGTPLTGPGCSRGYSVAAADFNGDGKSDVVLQCSKAAYFLFLGNGDGDGNFQTGMQFLDPPLTASTLLMVDLSGGGSKNLLAAGYKQQNVPSLAVLTNNGGGQFSLTQSRTPGWVVAAAVGDVNNDGIPDVVMTLADNNIDVIPGAGGGTLSPPPGIKSAMIPGMNALALADFNGDGKLDAVACGATNPGGQQRHNGWAIALGQREWHF